MKYDTKNHTQSDRKFWQGYFTGMLAERFGVYAKPPALYGERDAKG
jgi:hypothetical protein